MLDQLKYYLLFLKQSKKLKIACFALVILLGLFLTIRPAQALFGIGDVGLFDITGIHLDALDFVDNIMNYVVKIAVAIGLSSLLLTVSAALLSWAISLPLNLDSFLVVNGFQFILGLVNIFFILLLVAIAMAFILRIESFQAKKALQRLILIALLVNFSLVFVEIITDTGQLFLNSIIQTTMGPDIVQTAIAPMINYTSSIFNWLILIPAGYLTVAIIPFGNVAFLIAIGALIFSQLQSPGGGFIIQGLFLMIVNFVMSGVFFAYALLFISRIIVIWFLAMAAPLAFLSYIFPATSRYFKKWLHALFSWSILGIGCLFLAGLGLRLFSEVVMTQGGNIAGTSMPTTIFNYFFLIIYLVLALIACKKMAPIGANMIMKQGASIAMGAVGAVGKIGKRALQRTIAHRKPGELIDKAANANTKIPSWGDWKSLKDFRKNLGATARGTAGIGLQALGRKGLAYKSDMPNLIDKEMKNPELQKLVDSQNFGAMASLYQKNTSPEKKMAIASLLAKHKGEDGLNMLGDNGSEATRLIAERSPKHLKDLVAANPALAKQSAAINKLIKPDNVADQKAIKDMVDDGMNENGARESLAYKKAVSFIKNENIVNLSNKTFDDPNFQKEFVLSKDINSMVEVRKVKGQAVLDELGKKMIELGPKKLAKENSGLFLATISSPQRWALPTFTNDAGKEFSRNEANSLVKRMRSQGPEEKAVEKLFQELKISETKLSGSKRLLRKSKGGDTTKAEKEITDLSNKINEIINKIQADPELKEKYDNQNQRREPPTNLKLAANDFKKWLMSDSYKRNVSAATTKDEISNLKSFQSASKKFWKEMNIWTKEQTKQGKKIDENKINEKMYKILGTEIPQSIRDALKNSKQK